MLLPRLPVSQTGRMGTEEPVAPPGPMPEADAYARLLAGEALVAGDPTGWFERLYAAAATGHATVPWDRRAPHQLLVGWAGAAGLDGHGRRAVVVGCGLGGDAQYVAGLGFQTTAFDVSASAVRAARNRFPSSAVRYVTADLLSPPASWRHRFDLVVESMTLQALPDPPRRDAIINVGRLVRPGGTLLLIARARDADGQPDDGPPWALTREEVEAFLATGLQRVRIDDIRDPGPPTTRRWRAEFCRR